MTALTPRQGQVLTVIAATRHFDEGGFFTEALSETERNDVMDNGLAGYAAVDAAGKTTTTWAFLKPKK